jgi:hypothetical protein
MIITDKAQIKIAELRESNNLRLLESDELECYELIESDLKLPADATFTRSSVAYLSDGTQVVANTPRFEQGRFGKVVMVEEGTTNLLLSAFAPVSELVFVDDTKIYTASIKSGNAQIIKDIALQFDGQDDYVELSQALNIFSSSFTIEIGVFHTAESRAILLGDYVEDSTLLGTINVNFEITADNRLRLYWAGSPDLRGVKTVPVGQWCNVAFVRDKSNNKFCSYVEGSLDIDYSGALSDKVATIPHRIGMDSRTGKTAFEGRIKYIRIWNKALSQSEIQNNINKKFIGNESELVLCIEFNEASGTIVQDKSTSGNHSTINGAQWAYTEVGTVLPNAPLTFSPEMTGWIKLIPSNVEKWQLEAKPYATSFIDGTRSDETLTIPTVGVLNPQEGTVECWVNLNVWINDIFDYCLWSLNGSTRLDMWFSKINSNCLSVWDGTNWLNSGVACDGFVGTWHYIVYTWGTFGQKIYVDGVLKVSTTRLVSSAHIGSLLYIGSFHGHSYQTNFLIDDLRISNCARTDEEILAGYQSGKPLLVDEWTTYKLVFDDKVRITTQGQIICNELIEI